MQSFQKDKHDIGILRQDGHTKVGLMLAQKDNVPLYATALEAPLAQQMSTGTMGYGWFLPTSELPLMQDDWRQGISQEVYDPSVPKKYFTSQNFDLRFKGMGICGPKATAITMPGTIATAAAIANGTMEAASSWTGGSRDNTQKHGGSWAWEEANAEVYQEATTWSDTWRLKTFTFGCWVWAEDASSARIGISNKDADTPSYSSYHAGNSAWAFQTVTKTLDADATRIRVLLDVDGLNKAYFDDCWLGSPAASATYTFMDFNEKLYLGRGMALCELNSGGTAFEIVTCLPTAITDMEPFSDDVLYIAQGLSTNYYSLTTAKVLKEVYTTSDRQVKYLACNHAATPVMWGSDEVNKVSKTTNPAEGGTAWSGQTTIASSYHEITDLVSDGNSIYIPKEDRTYYLDSSENCKVLVEETRHLAATGGGKNTIVWQGKIYMPYGDESLVEYDDGTITWRSPAKYCTNLSTFDGQVFATAGDEEWLFAILNNGDLIEVLAGRLETIGDTTAWVWHPIKQLSLDGCECAYVSSVVQKRLWIASTDSDDGLYYIPLPAAYGDVAADANRGYDTSATMYFETPRLHGNFKGDDKSYIKLTLEMGDTTNDIYFEAHYKKAGDSSWTDIGDFKTSPFTTRYIPLDSSDEKPVAKWIKFKFVAKTNSATTTPTLKGYDCRAVLYPTRRKLTRTVVRCADDIKDKQGVNLGLTASEIREVIEEARDATWPVTFYDVWGDTKTVKIQPAEPFSRVIRYEKGRNIEEHFYLELEEVALE